jgi:hypothetical protein
MKMIKQLQKEKERLLEEYHANIRLIDLQIEIYREARGTKLKEVPMTGYHETGRDRANQTPHG